MIPQNTAEQNDGDEEESMEMESSARNINHRPNDFEKVYYDTENGMSQSS